MVNAKVAPKAIDVKASLEALIEKLDVAYRYSYGYTGAPKYVQYKMFYIMNRLLDLRQQARALHDKVPEKFQKER